MTQPALAFQDPIRGRIYRHPITGREVPSVTTISAMLHRPALERWKLVTVARKGLEVGAAGGNSRRETVTKVCGEPERIAADAAAIGDEVHNAAEALAKGEPVVVSKRAAPYVESWRAFMANHQVNILAVEQTVWNDTVGYAGTFDLLCELDGLVTLVDYKTSRALHEEIALQLVALAHGEHLVDPEGVIGPMPAVEQAVGVDLRPDGYLPRQVPLTSWAWEGFCGLRAAWAWVHQSPAALGQVLRPSHVEVSRC